MRELDDTTIAQRAYQLWDRRGRPWGSPELDWYAAIRELRSEAASANGDPAEPPFSEYRVEAEEV